MFITFAEIFIDKFSFICKYKCAYLKLNKSEKKTNFSAETSLNNNFPNSAV